MTLSLPPLRSAIKHGAAAAISSRIQELYEQLGIQFPIYLMFTKCDLMDDGTDCTALLSNRTLPLKLGYIAVVDRGQKATAG